MPSPHAIFVLALAFMVFFLYTRPWIAMEFVSLLLLASLLLVFHAFPLSTADSRITEVDVLQAFGHPALVAICSLMILGRGLTMTGALEPAVRLLARVWNVSHGLGLLMTLAVAAVASAFVNDTPVLVLMLPLLLRLSAQTGFPASKTLIPVNFAILAGGMLTSIGTSTNLLVLSIAADLGMRPMGILDFTGISAASLLVAVPYLWLVAPRLLPDRSGSGSEVERLFEASVGVPPDDDGFDGAELQKLSRAIGRPVPLVEVVRAGERIDPSERLVLRAGDTLVLNDSPEGLHEVASALGSELYDRDRIGRFVDSDATRVDTMLAEAVLGSDCSLVGRTLRRERFAERHGVGVVGVRRSVEELRRGGGDVADLVLQPGDVLLFQGPVDRIVALRDIPDLLILDSTVEIPRLALAKRALAIMAVVVLLASTKTLPIHVAAFLGVLAMLLSGCVRLHGMGRALSLEVILLVSSSIALGHALVQTGAADWIARGVTLGVGGLAPPLQLAAFMFFAAVLTNFVSNSAAAAVGTPIAVATAARLGSPVEPFVLAILFGANLSYATPMAYQTNLLVMSAGRYKFNDFLRVGTPLVLLMLGTLAILLSRRYGLS